MKTPLAGKGLGGCDLKKIESARHQHTPVAPSDLKSIFEEEPFVRLFHAIQDVREGSRTSSRTTKLLAGGNAKMAQKLIEEAAETVTTDSPKNLRLRPRLSPRGRQASSPRHSWGVSRLAAREIECYD